MSSPTPNALIGVLDERFAVPEHQTAAVKAARQNYLKMTAGSGSSIATRTLFLLIAALVALGWMVRDREYYTPEEGVGYGFGIIGGVMMLLLLLYPLRKKARFMRGWGSVKYWFEMHMLFGVLGPTFILFHANFHLGAINSNVALISMILVMLSGIVGRFVYVKVNYVMHGEQITLQELHCQLGISKTEITEQLTKQSAGWDRLARFETDELGAPGGPLRWLWRLLTLGRRTAWMEMQVLKLLKKDVQERAESEAWGIAELGRRLEVDRELIHSYLQSVRRLAEFTAYRQIFALWHVLHIPLFFMLVIASIIHIVAVHLY